MPQKCGEQAEVLVEGLPSLYFNLCLLIKHAGGQTGYLLALSLDKVARKKDKAFPARGWLFPSDCI